MVLSVKYYCDSDGATSNHIRIILRLTSGTTHKLVADTSISVLQIAKSICSTLTLNTLQPVLCPSAADCITYFDE